MANDIKDIRHTYEKYFTDSSPDISKSSIVKQNEKISYPEDLKAVCDYIYLNQNNEYSGSDGHIKDNYITNSMLKDKIVSLPKLADDVIAEINTNKGSPAMVETAISYVFKHPTISTGEQLYIAKTTGKMYFTKTGKPSCYIDFLMDLCNQYNSSTISGSKLANNSIANAKIQAGAITRSKIGLTAIGTDQLANKSVSLAKLADDTTNLHNSHIQRIDGNKNKIDDLENKYDAQGKLKLQYYQAGSSTFDGSAIDDGTIKSTKLKNSGNFDANYPLRFNSQGDFNTFAIDEAHLTDAVKNKLNSGGVADGSITTAKIADGAITNSKVGAGAITNSKIGTDAITRSKIDNGAVGKEQIGDQQISKSKLKMALQDKIDMIDANDANNATIQSYFDVNSKLRYSHLPKDYGYAERNRLTFGERSTGGIGIGKYSSGNLFIGENKTGGIFLAHNSTGSLSIADNITGSVALGHNATGALVIGSTKNQALSKIVSPSGEARFNEIVELVNHEKEHETLKEHIVLWSEYNQTNKTWNNESWEKELMASTPFTFTSDNNSDEFGFNFNNDLPNLGMPLGDWIIELFLQTATADNFNLFWLRHDTTLGQIKQHGTALTSSDWVSGSGHLLKDFDLQNPMKIRLEINNQGKDKRVKINAVRYCSYGASSYNRRWYEFKSAGTIRLKGADDDNFTINFELRKTTGSGATTLRTGSTIKIYRKGTK